MTDNPCKTTETNEAIRGKVPIVSAMRLDSSQYAGYLRTRIWLRRRCEVIARQYGKCARCRRYCPNAMQIHHLTYDRLGNERPEDLVGLCPVCHESADLERMRDEIDRGREAHRRRVASFIEWNEYRGVYFVDWIHARAEYRRFVSNMRDGREADEA